LLQLLTFFDFPAVLGVWAVTEQKTHIGRMSHENPERLSAFPVFHAVQIIVQKSSILRLSFATGKAL
jgi:hypothetical protein